MAKIELKKPIVEEIAENIDGAQSVVLVKYSGLTVEQDTRLRKELRENGIVYKVYKNTMMNFAFKGTPCEELSSHLEGPNAVGERILCKHGWDQRGCDTEIHQGAGGSGPVRRRRLIKGPL